MSRKTRSRHAHAGATPAIRALEETGVPYETVTYAHDERSGLGFSLDRKSVV